MQRDALARPYVDEREERMARPFFSTSCMKSIAQRSLGFVDTVSVNIPRPAMIPVSSAKMEKISRATTVNIKGDFYRLREKRKAGLVRSTLTTPSES